LACTDGILQGIKGEARTDTLRGVDVRRPLSKEELCTPCSVNTATGQTAQGEEQRCNACPEYVHGQNNGMYAKEGSAECAMCPVEFQGCKAVGAGDVCSDILGPIWQPVPPGHLTQGGDGDVCEYQTEVASEEAADAASTQHRDYARAGWQLSDKCPPGHLGGCTLKAVNELCDPNSWPVKIWENDVLINPSQTYNHQLCTSLPSCSHHTDGIWYELGQPTDSTTGTCNSLMDENSESNETALESYCNSAFMAADPSASETERQKSGVYYQCLTRTVADTTFGIPSGTTTHCKTYMPGELAGGGSSVCGHPDLYI